MTLFLALLTVCLFVNVQELLREELMEHNN